MNPHLKRLHELRANCPVADASYIYADALDEAIAALEALPRLRRIEAAARDLAAALAEEP